MSTSLRVEIDLSVAILPKFVAAARVHSSLYQEKPSLRTFYQNVTADLVAFHEILSGLREHHDSVLGQLAGGGLSLAVQKVLLRLERIARTRGDKSAAHPFRKLQTLKAASTTTSNDLCGLRRLSSTGMKDNRAKLLHNLDKCLATLTGIVIQQGRLPTETSWQEGNQTPGNPMEGPLGNPMTDDDSPDLAHEVEALHKAMAVRWPCSCWRRHGALLRLTSFYIESDINVHPAFYMDLLFSHNSVDSWKRAKIRLEKRAAQVHWNETVTNPPEYADQFTTDVHAPLGGLGRSEQRSIQSVLSSAYEADDANCRNIPVQPIGTLCRLTLECNQNAHLIYLLARKQRKEVHLRGKLKGLANYGVDRLIPLSTILNDTGNNAFLDLRQNVKERLMLANILAKAVLHLCASPWVRRQWVKERLCLALSEREHSPTDSVLQLHLKSDLDEQTDCGDYYEVQHPCPILVDLGILLVELELGKPIQELIELMEPGHQAAAMAFHRNLSISVLKRVLKSGLLSRTFVPYYQAIWACYDCKAVGSNITEIRQWIKDKISGPLNQLLLASYQVCITPEGIQTLQSQPMSFRGSIERNKSPAESTAHIADDNYISILCQRGRFLDCERSLLPDDASKWAGADDWFENLQRKTLSHFKRLGVTGRNDQPIKIAILDTGIDARLHPRTRAIMATNPQLSGSSGRIKGLRSWADDKVEGEDVESMKDEHGHGTHAAGLILKVTPFAHLYVAQVTNGLFFEPDPVAVGQAIKYAAEDWKVDIISMSFGFDDRIGDIAEAIDTANARGVIMLAAASNGGKIKSEGDSYPAASVEVISVRSANGDGRSSDFNPDKPDDKVYSAYFNVVGEYVLSAWPEHLEPSGERRASGTSVSTPIAAGVVALFLEYIWARLPGSLGEADKMAAYERIRRSPNATGMRMALRFMASKKDKSQGLCFIKPWLLMSEQANTRWRQFQEQFKIPREDT
ncbi:hypothetical protein CLAIMM_14113 isoform 1 [Cladophialophora immunda]|nr:hypothetical protein CLAIMM_14113 isoform 1 [Cladophialophora immunda]